MKNFFIIIRNSIIKFCYKYLLKPILFLIDAEKMHDAFVHIGNFLGNHALTAWITKVLFSYSNKSLQQKICGIDFSNPLGLAAGFDKNAEITGIIPAVGFGHMTVGSVTGEPCEGNPKPRLWRLKKSKGIVVYYGLKNDGAIKISEKIKNKKFKIPVGVSVAKTNCRETAEIENAIADYLKAYKSFYEKDIGDYYEINISCPNAYGGEPFTDPESLDKLLNEICKLPKKKPLFLKIAPGLSENTLDHIMKISAKYSIDGFVCTNLTKDRNALKIVEAKIPDLGSVSGKPAKEASNRTIEYIYRKSKGKFVIIGCGGIFSAEDAYEKIKLGASLLQLITGMIFEGPQVISEINLGLTRLLKKDGYKNIVEAVGKGL